MKTAKATHASHLRVGMPVVFSDGWRGKIAEAAGGIVACVADGQKPNDHWVGDYRLTGPSRVTVEGKTATVRWGLSPTAEQRAARAAIVDELLRCSLLERSWADRPGG